MARSNATDLATSFRRRLRLVTGRPPAAVLTNLKAAPATSRQVQFVAYAEDCLVSGFVRLDADRLTDLLNEHDEIELADVLVQDLAAGTDMEVATSSSCVTSCSWSTPSDRAETGPDGRGLVSIRWASSSGHTTSGAISMRSPAPTR